MNVDREQQKEILQILFDDFPWGTQKGRHRLLEMIKSQPERTIGNLLYLQMHGLIENAVTIKFGDNFEDGVTCNRVLLEAMGEKVPDGNIFAEQDGSFLVGPATFLWPQLTEKGVDFLLGDDGISSILNVRRVRIEESSLKVLATTLMDLAASTDQEERVSILDKLKEAPIEGIKDFIKTAVTDELSSREISKKIARFILSSCGIPFIG